LHSSLFDNKYAISGNIALQKNAEQSSTKWGDMYLASNAVDGRVDLLSYQHCAVPNAMRGTNAWWKIDFGGNYKLSRVIIYNTNTGTCQTCSSRSSYVSYKTKRISGITIVH